MHAHRVDNWVWKYVPLIWQTISGEWPTFWRYIIITKHIHADIVHAKQLSTLNSYALNWLQVRQMWTPANA